VPLIYRERRIDVGFRVDLLIENRLVLELKAVERVLPVHKAQLITYLKVLNQPLGLFVNFNEALVKDGIHRIFNPRLA
jgi:GxxExxY protein